MFNHGKDFVSINKYDVNVYCHYSQKGVEVFSEDWGYPHSPAPDWYDVSTFDEMFNIIKNL